MKFLDKILEHESGKKLSKDEALRRIPVYLAVTVAVSIVLTIALQAAITAATGGGAA